MSAVLTDEPCKGSVLNLFPVGVMFEILNAHKIDNILNRPLYAIGSKWDIAYNMFIKANEKIATLFSSYQWYIIRRDKFNIYIIKTKVPMFDLGNIDSDIFKDYHIYGTRLVGRIINSCIDIYDEFGGESFVVPHDDCDFNNIFQV